jgi:predicted DNA-binding transcriptional regulator AlpA
MSEVYLTEDEFCDRYKVTKRTAQSWRYSGDNGPPWVRLGGRRIGYRVSDCEAWAAARTYTSRAQELVSKAA